MLPDRLADILGLSRPAGQLACALASGETLRRYAGRIGISINTAKFHLKDAFAATGTHRQVDLARLVSTLTRDLGSKSSRRQQSET